MPEESPLPPMAPRGGESNTRYTLRIALMVILVGMPLAGLLTYMARTTSPCDPLLLPVQELSQSVERARRSELASALQGVDYDGARVASTMERCCQLHQEGDIGPSDYRACTAFADLVRETQVTVEESLASRDAERLAAALAEVRSRRRVLVAGFPGAAPDVAAGPAARQ